MLKERITFKSELPVNVLVADIEEYPIHFHDELEMVFVLKGHVKLRNGYYNYDLKQGDIFTLNDREIHSFSRIGNQENMVMLLQMDLTYFSRYYNNLKNNFFVTDMEDDDDESLDILRKFLAKIMMDILEKGFGYEQKVIESTHNLIASLQADFQYFVMEDGRFVNEAKKKGNKILAGRLNRITDYMYDNYYRKLTLKEIAEKEHLSIYYLSHVIKEATGLSFQDLLNFIRVEESEKLLLGTGKRIGAIAEETGFSAVRYYVKHFETWFHMHPAEYRKKFTGKVSGRESGAKMRRATPAEIEEALKQQVKGLYRDYFFRNAIKPIIVDLDIDKEVSGTFGKVVMDELMEKNIMKPVSAPYIMMKNLKEEIITSGDNYLISAKKDEAGEINALSILTYNFSQDLGRELGMVSSKEELINSLSVYDSEGEILVRCAGMTGDFTISRYRISRQNCLMAIDSSGIHDKSHTAREILRGKLAAMPVVEFEEFHVADTISVRSTIKGFGAELILIDKKTAK